MDLKQITSDLATSSLGPWSSLG